MDDVELQPFADDDLRARYEEATALVEDPRLVEAWVSVTRDTDLRQRVRDDPAGTLREWGIEIPEALSIEFLERVERGKPTPDYEFFTIELVNCRTFWVKKEGGRGVEQVEICTGFRVVPNPLPGGPIARGR